MNEDYTNKALWFVAGVAVGSTLALLFAPQSGEETRRAIRKTAKRGRKAIDETGREMYAKGKELYDKGRQMADEAADLFERGRKLVEG